MDRIIGEYSSGKEGPLLIIIGAVHGNEVAGPSALKLFFNLIENEKSIDPDFFISGKVIGLHGNLSAFKDGSRYLDYDMNRAWTPGNILNILEKKTTLRAEDKEIQQFMRLITEIIKVENPDKIIIMDLHTTSSDGGTFTIPSDDRSSVALSKKLLAPLILGMLDDVKGTAIEFLVKYLGRKWECQSIVFESGQHYDPLSIDRALAAIVNLMKVTGIVESRFVEEKHTKILEDFSKKLPSAFKLKYKYSVINQGQFTMKAGFESFQEIKKGDFLAMDGDDQINALNDGRILMPLYQRLGEDGFFIIEEIK